MEKQYKSAVSPHSRETLIKRMPTIERDEGKLASKNFDKVESVASVLDDDMF